MAETGFTPVQLYRSATASAQPVAGDLLFGELAINYADGNLFFKDSSNVVRLLASTAAATGTVSSVAASGGTTGLTFSGSPITTSGTLTLGGTLAVAHGGTGATSAANARTNLGLGTIATQNSSAVSITGGSITGITDLAVADGGTGASTAAVARTNLGAAASGAIGSSGLTMTTARLLGRTTAATGAVEEITVGSGLSLSAGTLTASGSGGTVTSVAASGGSTGLTFSGSPITTSGTLTLGGTLAVGSGGTGTGTAFTPGSVVFAGASGVYSQDNANLFWDNTNDRLGIGTNTPAARLDVQHNLNGNVTMRAVNTNAGASADARSLVSNGTAAGGFIMRGTGNTSANHLTIFNDSVTAPITFFTSGSERVRIESGGNVGIGTTSPSAKVDVAAAGDGAALLRFTTERPWVFEQGGAGAVARLELRTTTDQKNFRIVSEDKSKIVADFSANNVTSSVSFCDGTLFANTTGNVGIGTTSPQSPLHVVGTSRLGASSSDAVNACLGVYPSGGGLSVEAFQGNNTATKRDIFLNAFGGNVGIGTSSPSARLDVVGSTELNGDVSIPSGTATYGGIEIGWRKIPKSSNSTGTLTADNAGKYIHISGNVTVPNSVFSQGDIICIINYSATPRTITQGSGVTLRWQNGTTGPTGNRTLAAWGVATIVFDGPSIASIFGTGIS